MPLQIGLNIMRKLIDVVKSPTSFDSLSNYMGYLPENKFLCVLTRTRDADVLSRSNFESTLEALGGESETVQIFRFNHWACGWWEALAVVKYSKEYIIATNITNALHDYPVVDEEHFSRLETEEADEVWESCYNEKERLAYIREHRNQFDFHNIVDIINQVRGKYFSGYASELI